MKEQKPKSKRKIILAIRAPNSQKVYKNNRKDNRLHQFDVGLTAHVKKYIDIEKDKLKSLDKKTAKKVVGNAENNLLTFFNSRAKIYCLRSQQIIHPFHLNQVEKQVTKPDFFDKNKLYHQIAREQRHQKAKTVDCCPLLQVCLREAASNVQNRKNEVSQKIEAYKKSSNYMPLSAHHRLKKMFF